MVVRRLDAGLADRRARPDAAVGVVGDLHRADLAEQAEELAPERTARVAPLRQRDDTDPGELARVLVDEVPEVPRDPRQDDGGRVRRLELAVADTVDESLRRGAGETTEAAEEHAALVGRPPASVLVDQAEDGRVDGDGEATLGAREQVPPVVDDRPARRRQVDEAEGLLLRRRDVRRAADDLQRPQPQREQPEERGGHEADDPDAQVKAAAAVKFADDDGDRAQAEAARDAHAPRGPARLGSEITHVERQACPLCHDLAISAWG